MAVYHIGLVESHRLRSRTITEQIRFKDDPVATASDIRGLPQNSQLILIASQAHGYRKSPELLRVASLFSTLYGSWRS